jgi:hypothetical protein
MAETPRDHLNNRQVTRKAIPLQKAHVHDTAATADTDILAADITPSTFIDSGGNTIAIPVLFRIMVQTDTAAKFSALVDDDSSEVQLFFNGNSDLTEGALYMFDMLVDEDDNVNFQFDDNVNVDKLIVQEIAWGTQ